jgi:pyrimidine-nucleoside phosphorylase
MLILGGAAGSLAAAEARVAEAVASGRAMARYRDWVSRNGGDAQALDDFSRMPQAARSVPVRAERGGHVQAIQGRALGLLAMELGAGRRQQGDQLDLGVGIRVHVQVGQRVEPGQTLLTLHCNEREGSPLPPDWITLIDAPCEPAPWLLETVEA